MAQTYSYKRVRNHWVVFDIRTQRFVKWFTSEAMAMVYATIKNERKKS